MLDPETTAARTWSIALTNAELNAIYTAIEGTPFAADLEAAYESVVEKITPAKVGGPPAGAAAAENFVTAKTRRRRYPDA